MTETEATRLVGGLMAAYRTGEHLAPETIDAYIEDILDLDYEPAAIAVKQLRQTRTFLPSIAELRQATAIITTGRLPDPDEAWAEVMQQLRAVGHSGQPTFTDSAIAATVRAMGWLELCASTNQVADRAHFLKLYGTARARIDQQRIVDPAVNELADTLAQMYALPEQKRPALPVRSNSRA
jgi:hypothetical protein